MEDELTGPAAQQLWYRQPVRRYRLVGPTSDRKYAVYLPDDADRSEWERLKMLLRLDILDPSLVGDEARVLELPPRRRPPREFLA